jgi:UDP-N-acetylglucosamine--N-acetylmuramyl-(pentapeptide) pyrophosphoryl-undecaprenol N-acetylglucosamine transferase
LFSFHSRRNRINSNRDAQIDELALLELQNKKVLIISSSGGHLLEAQLVSEQLGLSPDSIFVTHRNSQSVSLLTERNHAFVKNVKSRDWVSALKVVPTIFKLCRSKEYDLIISTGAAIAISALPAHIFLRKPFYYFESLTRQHSPSFTGRILELFPTVIRYSECADRFGKKWKNAPSVLKHYKVEDRKFFADHFRIFVTVGTMPNFRFDRLINNLLPALRPGDELYWQLGCTTRKSLPGTIYEDIPNSQLMEIAKSCDLVISHCGIGTVLDLLSIGVRPLVCARLKSMKEHVDDHQLEAAEAFEKPNLVQVFSKELTRMDLELAAKKRIRCL